MKALHMVEVEPFSKGRGPSGRATQAKGRRCSNKRSSSENPEGKHQARRMKVEQPSTTATGYQQRIDRIKTQMATTQESAEALAKQAEKVSSLSR